MIPGTNYRPLQVNQYIDPVIPAFFISSAHSSSYRYLCAITFLFVDEVQVPGYQVVSLMNVYG